MSEKDYQKVLDLLEKLERANKSLLEYASRQGEENRITARQFEEKIAIYTADLNKLLGTIGMKMVRDVSAA